MHFEVDAERVVQHLSLPEASSMELPLRQTTSIVSSLTWLCIRHTWRNAERRVQFPDRRLPMSRMTSVTVMVVRSSAYQSRRMGGLQAGGLWARAWANRGLGTRPRKN